MKRRIVPGGILALSLAVVLLAATASTASADRDLSVWCAPLPTTPTPIEELPGGGCIESHPPGAALSFDFGDRQVGTTSPAQGFALAVFVGGGAPPGTTDTFNPRISVSGDYAQTNNCPPTLSVTGFGNQGCLITVTFTPTGTGPKEGTLSTGPGGPTAALTGTGVTTPTPPVLPLELDASVRSPQTLNQLGRKGVVRGIDASTETGHCKLPGCPKYDSTLVLRGDVKKTTTQLTAEVGGAPATPRSGTIEARVKHLKRLKEEPTSPKIKIKFTATDEFGQTVTKERKVTLCSRLVPVPNHDLKRCVWHPSQK
jgi:hypothetical protein